MDAKLLRPDWLIAQTKLFLSPKYQLTKTSDGFNNLPVLSMFMGFGSIKSKYSG